MRSAAYRCLGLTLAVSLCLAATLAAQDPKKSTQSRIEKKKYDFKDAGKEMEYGLFVPTTYDKEKKAPLVVALHGLGSNPQQILRYRGLTDQAEKYGYIVAAPMGYNERGWYGARTLNRQKDDPTNLSELSEKDVMNVLDLVKKDYNIDDKRIYLMGHSMGGGGTWHLGIKYPDLWAGLAPIAPAVFRPASDVEKIKNIPVMLIQGDTDKLVAVDGARRWAAQMKKLDMTYEYIEVKDGGHVDVAMTLPKSVTALPGGTGVTCAVAVPSSQMIFEFFNAHPKKEKGKEGGKP